MPLARFCCRNFLSGLMLVLFLATCCADTTLAAETIELKTSQARLLVDELGRVAVEPNDAACPAPARFQTPLWVITLAQGTDPFHPGRVITVSQSGTPQITAEQNGVRIVYNNLTHGETAIDVQLDLTITAVDDEFRFGGTIVNNSQNLIVTEWKYPIFLGIEGDRESKQHATPMVLWPNGLGQRFPRLELFGSHRAFEYPGGHGTMQWLAFTHGDTGLYFGCHDPQCKMKTFAAAHTRGVGYDVSLKHLPYCVPGQRWEGPPTAVMPYAGPWYIAARRYRQWFQSWTDPLPQPQWVKDSTGCLLTIMKQQNGDLMWKYGSLERLADLAEERGLDMIGLFGWAHGGHDRYYPDYIPDSTMGGAETLKESIKKVQQRGLRVFLYANGQLIDSATEFYRLQGVQTIIADQRGRPTFDMYNKFKATSTPIFVIACPAAPLWRDRMLTLAKQAHALGADGILFDQLGVVSPRQCFTASHGHKTPADAEGRLDLIRGIARQMRKLDPEFVILTEGVVDAEQTDIAYFHGCGMGFYYFEPGTSETTFPELFRYTFPGLVATQRVPNPFLTRNFANYACAYGLRFEIESRYTADVKYLTTDQVPTPEEYADCNSPPNVSLVQTTPCKESAHYMQQVAQFRSRHGELLLLGDFSDMDGLETAAGPIVVKAFRSKDRVGVLLWNPTAEEHSAQVNVPGYQLSAAYAPESTGRVDGNAPLAAESIRLLIWKK